MLELVGVEEKNKATVSRFIREAVKEGVIQPYDDDAAEVSASVGLTKAIGAIDGVPL